MHVKDEESWGRVRKAPVLVCGGQSTQLHCFGNWVLVCSFETLQCAFKKETSDKWVTGNTVMLSLSVIIHNKSKTRQKSANF